jgi:kynureninase
VTSDTLLAFRAEFPILERTTYLVSNSLGAMPRTVPARLAEYAEQWASHGVRAWARGWWEMPLALGDELAPLIGAAPGTVAMAPTVTFAQAVVLSALSFGGGRDTIVMSALDFPSVRYLYEELAPKLGARVVVVPSDDGISIDEERLCAAIDERTALVAISHVLFKSAYIVDVARVAAHAHRMGALVALDAYHSVGVVPVDVRAIGADFLMGGVLKWLCGGPGGCFLYASPEVSARFAPALTGWQAHAHPFAFDGEMEYADGAARWLGGTPVIPALFANMEGPRIVRRAGMAAIRAKSMRQTARLVDLADAHGYPVTAPRDPHKRGGTVAFDVPHGAAVAQALLARDVIIDYRPGAGIRVAPHFYTTDDEVERAVGETADILETGAWKEFAGSRPKVT